MKLQHSLGGLEGLGPVNYEKRVFVQDWETRIFGIHTAFMGLSQSLRDAIPDYDLESVPTEFRSTWTWADLRKGAEAMNPFAYFQYRYYEKWLGGISSYCIEQGYVTEEELTETARQVLERPDLEPPTGGDPGIDDQVIRYLREGDSPLRGSATPAFEVGETVVIADPPAGEHTRLPGYLRGKVGVVDSIARGNYTYFCPTGRDGLGEPVPVYIVRFDPIELWGETAEDGASPLYAELYEPYLTKIGSREKAS